MFYLYFYFKIASLPAVPLFLQSASANLLITLIGYNFDPSLSSCRRSINKQFSIDSFLDLEGHWIFHKFSHLTHSLSSDHSTLLSTIQDLIRIFLAWNEFK